MMNRQVVITEPLIEVKTGLEEEPRQNQKNYVKRRPTATFSRYRGDVAVIVIRIV